MHIYILYIKQQHTGPSRLDSIFEQQQFLNANKHAPVTKF